MNVLDMLKLNGKTAIVTGGAGRYGKQIVEGLGEAGATRQIELLVLNKFAEIKEYLNPEIIKEAFEKTYDARCKILDEVMLPCIAEPRAELSKYAPKLLSTKIDVDKIGDVIKTFRGKLWFAGLFLTLAKKMSAGKPQSKSGEKKSKKKKSKKMTITYDKGNNKKVTFNEFGEQLSEKQRAAVEMAEILHSMQLRQLSG